MENEIFEPEPLPLAGKNGGNFGFNGGLGVEWASGIGGLSTGGDNRGSALLTEYSRILSTPWNVKARLTYRSGYVIWDPSMVKLDNELLVTMMNFEGKRVGIRVLGLSCWRSEKERRCGIMW